jgi:hypothetical protein
VGDGISDSADGTGSCFGLTFFGLDSIGSDANHVVEGCISSYTIW